MRLATPGSLEAVGLLPGHRRPRPVARRGQSSADRYLYWQEAGSSFWSPSKVFDLELMQCIISLLFITTLVPGVQRFAVERAVPAPRPPSSRPLDRDREILVAHRLDQLAMKRAAVAEAPVQAALHLLAEEAVLDREHVVRVGRLIEEMAEGVRRPPGTKRGQPYTGLTTRR